MRKIITLLAAPLLAAFALLTSFSAQAADAGFQWQHFNVKPYANSREEAMSTREQAFRCLGVTDPEAIAALVKATEQPGKKVTITNGDHFGAMLSKGCVAHQNVNVAWTKPPMKNIQYASTGEEWRKQVGFKIYVLTRPDICNNWSITIIDVPAPPAPPAMLPAPTDCLTHHIQVPYEATLHRAMFARRPIPHSVCNKIGLEHGTGTAYHCDVCTFESDVLDLREKGYIGMIQPNTIYRFTCEQKEGCVIIESEPVTTGDRIDDDIFLYCLTYPNGGRSLVEDLHWQSYHNRHAYVGDTAPADWQASGGVLHVWKEDPEQQ